MKSFHVIFASYNCQTYPPKIVKSKRDLPWLNHAIKSKMRHRKRHYDIEGAAHGAGFHMVAGQEFHQPGIVRRYGCNPNLGLHLFHMAEGQVVATALGGPGASARQSGKSEDLAAYRRMTWNVLIVPIVVDYLRIHFLVIVSNSGSTFAPDENTLLVRISTLLDNGEYVSDPKGKASTLGNQFLSVFTIEDHNSVQVYIPSITYLLCLPSLLVLRGLSSYFVMLMPAKLWVLTRLHPIH